MQTQPQFSLIAASKFRSGEPFVARTGGRAVVSTINTQIISLIALHLRMAKLGSVDPTAPSGEERFGAVGLPGHGPLVGKAQLPLPGKSLDERNALDHAVTDAETETEQRAAHGVAEYREPPLHVAGRLKLIRDSISKSLDEHAGLRDMPLPVGGKVMQVKDTFHIGQPISESLEFMYSNAREVSDLIVKEQAKALGITEEEVRIALAARPAARQKFLFENRVEIMRIIPTLIGSDAQKNALSLEQDEEAFEALEPMTKVILLASADRAWHRGWQREIQGHMDGNPLAQSNMAVLDGVRRQARQQFEDWMKVDAFQRSFHTALERGAKMPNFGPKPRPAEAMEAEKVLARKAA